MASIVSFGLAILVAFGCGAFAQPIGETSSNDLSGFAVSTLSGLS